MGTLRRVRWRVEIASLGGIFVSFVLMAFLFCDLELVSCNVLQDIHGEV